MSARHVAAPRPDSEERIVTVDGQRVYDADTLGDELLRYFGCAESGDARKAGSRPTAGLATVEECMRVFEGDK